MRVTPFYLFAGAVSWPLIRFLFRLRHRGVENLPKSGGFVISANHESNIDPFPLGLPLFPKRQLHFMAKAELFNKVLGRAIRAGGAFPVRRGEADREAIATAIEMVKEGKAVAIFPEGTRREKGLRKKFKPRPHTGAARIALEADAPLIPAAIKGTNRLSRLGPLRVAYGPPVDLDDLRNGDPREGAKVATERLFAEIERLKASL